MLYRRKVRRSQRCIENHVHVGISQHIASYMKSTRESKHRSSSSTRLDLRVSHASHRISCLHQPAQLEALATRVNKRGLRRRIKRNGRCGGICPPDWCRSQRCERHRGSRPSWDACGVLGYDPLFCDRVHVGIGRCIIGIFW